MRSLERVHAILGEAFKPLLCVAEVTDYSAKVGFRIYDTNDKPLIKYGPVPISNLLSGPTLEMIIYELRQKIVVRGIELDPWEFSSLNRALHITFPGKFALRSDLSGVNFLATVDGQPVTCHITTEALQDIEPQNARARALEQFARNQFRIECIAERLVREQFPTQPVLVTSSDVNP